MLKIRRSREIGIHISGKDGLYIETGTRYLGVSGSVFKVLLWIELLEQIEVLSELHGDAMQ